MSHGWLRGGAKPDVVLLRHPAQPLPPPCLLLPLPAARSMALPLLARSAAPAAEAWVGSGSHLKRISMHGRGRSGGRARYRSHLTVSGARLAHCRGRQPGTRHRIAAHFGLPREQPAALREEGGAAAKAACRTGVACLQATLGTRCLPACPCRCRWSCGRRSGSRGGAPRSCPCWRSAPSCGACVARRRRSERRPQAPRRGLTSGRAAQGPRHCPEPSSCNSLSLGGLNVNSRCKTV